MAQQRNTNEYTKIHNIYRNSSNSRTQQHEPRPRQLEVKYEIV